MKDKNKKANIYAFLSSFFYVGLGTLSVCSLYPKDIFSGAWTIWGLLLTFPVSVISFGYRYAESNNLYPVFIIQTTMFILTFIAARRIFRAIFNL